MSTLYANQLARVQRIVQFLTTHAPEISNTPQISEKLLPTLQNAVNITLPGTLLPHTADSKNALRLALQDNVYHVAMGLVAYADDTDDFILENMADFSYEEIQSFRDVRLQQFALTVYTKAMEPSVAGALSRGYNVSAADLEDLVNAIRNYGVVMSAIEETPGGNAYVMLNSTTSIFYEPLDKIRRKMRTYRKTNRNLYDKWLVIDSNEAIPVAMAETV